MNKKRKNIFNVGNKTKLVVIAVLMLFVFATVSYGVFVTTKTQENDNTIASTCMSTSFTDGNSISLSGNNAMPISDAEGLSSTPYSFTLTNDATKGGQECNVTLKYYVILSTKTGSFSDQYVKYSVANGGAHLLTNARTNNIADLETGYSNSYIIYTGTLDSGDNVTVNVRLWLNETTEYANVSGSSWEGEIKVISIPADTANERAKFLTGDAHTNYSKIAVGNQNFYLISNTNGTIRMLSEYNLTNLNTDSPIQDTTGAANAIAFGSAWDYSTSNIKTYAENYVAYLNQTYKMNITADNLTETELKAACGLTGTAGSGTCNDNYPWIYAVPFWTKTLYNSNTVWFIATNRTVDALAYSNSSSNGVRPVIIIDESLIDPE